MARRFRFPTGLLTVGVALGSVILVVQPGEVAAQVEAREYAARRAALVATIDSGVIIAYGGVEPVNYWPSFFQLPAFHYLTGFDETNAVLMMVKRGRGAAATMFVPRRDYSQARWVGTRTAPGALDAAIGIAGRDIAAFRPAIDSLAAAGLPIYVVPDAHAADYAAEDSLTRGSRLLAQLRAAHPTLAIFSLDSAVNHLRAKKSAAEIALLRKAVQISARAHVEAMKATAPGCGENEIQSVLDGTFRRLGGDRPGYGSIVGSGPNATVLHYMKDDRVMRDGELLLIDAATSYDHYSADVTRTLPVNGKFTTEQREIYQLVRDVQEAYVRQLRPGSAEGMAFDSARTVANRGLVRLGLIESDSAHLDGPEAWKCPPEGCSQRALYFWHGYGGHGIGTEVHDPAQYYEGGKVFRIGDVMTVEPGIYVDSAFVASLPDTPRNRAMRTRLAGAMARYNGIGVRIEDDYVVTATGTEWLSKGAPREIREIEAMMKQKAPDLPGGGSCGEPRT